MTFRAFLFQLQSSCKPLLHYIFSFLAQFSDELLHPSRGDPKVKDVVISKRSEKSDLQTNHDINTLVLISSSLVLYQISPFGRNDIEAYSAHFCLEIVLFMAYILYCF